MTDYIQIALMGILVGTTIFYAYQAKKANDSAKASAQASVKMAEQVEEQRYSECLPLLVPTIPPILKTDELPYESLQSGVGMKVLWRNVGKGVAINSRFSFWTAPTSPGKATFFPPRESGTLEVGGKKEVDYSEILDDGQSHAISDTHQPRLEAEYRDIYKRHITTVQEFRIEEQDNNKRAFMGELYFTVNGKRLGEEITRHD